MSSWGFNFRSELRLTDALCGSVSCGSCRSCRSPINSPLIRASGGGTCSSEWPGLNKQETSAKKFGDHEASWNSECSAAAKYKIYCGPWFKSRRYFSKNHFSDRNVRAVHTEVNYARTRSSLFKKLEILSLKILKKREKIQIQERT